MEDKATVGDARLKGYEGSSIGTLSIHDRLERLDGGSFACS